MIFESEKFWVGLIQDSDLKEITYIYNSNKKFLPQISCGTHLNNKEDPRSLLTP